MWHIIQYSSDKQTENTYHKNIYMCIVSCVNEKDVPIGGQVDRSLYSWVAVMLGDTVLCKKIEALRKLDKKYHKIYKH